MTTLRVRDENEYEDLLAEWSDLESGLGMILGNPESVQQFAHRVLPVTASPARPALNPTALPVHAATPPPASRS